MKEQIIDTNNGSAYSEFELEELFKDLANSGEPLTVQTLFKRIRIEGSVEYAEGMIWTLKRFIEASYTEFFLPILNIRQKVRKKYPDAAVVMVYPSSTGTIEENYFYDSDEEEIAKGDLVIAKRDFEHLSKMMNNEPFEISLVHMDIRKI